MHAIIYIDFQMLPTAISPAYRALMAASDLLCSWQRGDVDLSAFPLSGASYVVDRMLGKGSFASVFSAKRQSAFEPQTRVALKIMPRAVSSDADANAYEGCRELEIMLKLRASAHIAQLNEYFFLDVLMDEYYCQQRLLVLVLPQFDCNLGEYISLTSDTPRLPQAQHVAGHVAQALAYIHAMGFVHRDLKLDNVLVRDNAHDRIRPLCVLADFGHAKQLVTKQPADQGDANCPYAFARFYRAPELLLGSSSYGPQADVWAWGCIVAEVLLSEEYLEYLFAPRHAEETDTRTHTLLARMSAGQLQLLEIFESLGTPQFDELLAMNVHLAHDVRRQREWMRVPPRSASRPWQTRVYQAIERHARRGFEGQQWRVQLERATYTLQSIFQYRPNHRPTAEALRAVCWMV